MEDIQARLQLALTAANMTVWDSTIVEGRIDRGMISWSAEGAAMIGKPPAPLEQPFSEFALCIADDDRDRVVQTMQEGVEHGDGYEVDYKLHLPAGAKWVAARARILRDDHGKPFRTLGVISDQTSRVAREQAAANRDRLAETTLRAIGDGVIRTDACGKTTFMNRAAETLTGWPVDKALGIDARRVLALVDEHGGVPLDNPVVKCLQQMQTIGAASRSQLVTYEGRHVDAEVSVAPVWSEEGELTGTVAVLRDVSHERRLANQLVWQARHDALTGLANRVAFEGAVGAALHGAKTEAQVHALLYMDLDRFKLVNDTCGHAAGDLLLKLLCKLLHSHMREVDILARLGGDELGALLLNCPPDQALLVAEELRASVNAFRFAWDDRTFDVGISIGLVEIADDSVSTSELLVAADQACYLAKDKGGNRVHIYRESDVALARKRGELRWLPRLHDALDKNLFLLAAMPIQNLHDAGDIHYEILLRMRGESDELISPSTFIPAAERYELMNQIDRWVISEVFAHIAQHRPASPHQAQGARAPARPPTYSINLSGLSLGAKGFFDYITGKLAQYGISPHLIGFEITETAVIANFDEAVDFMHKLRDIGCSFSLDDFGNGLSSFAYIKSLPVDCLKIDGLFIRDLATNPVNQALVRAINQVGHTLGLKTVAEYVDDPETMRMVRAIGLDYAQGHAVGMAQLIDIEAQAIETPV